MNNEMDALIATAERIAEQLRAMPLDELIDLWNDKVADHYSRSLEVYEMNDHGWWGCLADEIGTDGLAEAVANGTELGFFNPNDRYFFYDADQEEMHSFNGKEDVFDKAFDIVVLIEVLMNEEEED